jgi:rhomboid protease GluP
MSSLSPRPTTPGSSFGAGSAAPPARSPFLALGVLVALNVGAFLAEIAAAPFNDTLGGSLVLHGGLSGPAVDHGDWWRIVTAGFLHSGFAHLAGNLVALVVLGLVLTLAIGPLRMVLLYAAGLLGSSCAVLAFAPMTLTVGASGAIFGLAGGALLVGVRRKRLLLLVFAGAWILYTLSSTLFVPGISQAGHFGGLVAGALAGWLLVGPEEQLRGERAAVALVFGLVAVLFGAALVV